MSGISPIVTTNTSFLQDNYLIIIFVVLIVGYIIGSRKNNRYNKYGLINKLKYKLNKLYHKLDKQQKLGLFGLLIALIGFVIGQYLIAVIGVFLLITMSALKEGDRIWERDHTFIIKYKK
jgi:uncharacterized membrane protein YhaH (DUF805 family)